MMKTIEKTCRWWVLLAVGCIALGCSNKPKDSRPQTKSLSTSNGLGENGLTTNGLISNGMWVNGMWVNGMWVNGMWVNGMWVNGMWVNGLLTNGMWVNGMWVNGLTGDLAVPGDLLRQSPHLRQLLQYVYSCAMPPATYDTELDPNDGALTCLSTEDCEFGYECSSAGTCVVPLRGAIGVGINDDGTSWGESGECRESCQRWVSACVLARANAYGVKVEISMRAPANAPQAIKDALAVTDFELNGDATHGPFSLREGAYYGNIFATKPTTPAPCSTGECAATGPIASTPAFYACAGPGSNIPAITNRFCSSQGDQVLINVPGVCLGTDTPVCEGEDNTDPPSPTFGAIQDCHTQSGPGGEVYKEVITVYLRQHIAACGNNVCEEGEEGASGTCAEDCPPGWAKSFSPNIANDFVGNPGYAYTAQYFYGDQYGMSAVAPDGSVAVVGTAAGDVRLDGSEVLPASSGVGILARFDQDGHYLWGRRFGGTTESTPGGKLLQVNGVTVAANGNITLVGAARQLATQVIIDYIWVSTYSPDGDLLSHYSFHAGPNFRQDGQPVPFLQISRSIATDSQGNLIVAGRYVNGLSPFGASGDLPSAFLAKLSPSGARLWNKTFPSREPDPRNDLTEAGHSSVAVDVDDNVIWLVEDQVVKYNPAGDRLFPLGFAHYAFGTLVVPRRLAVAVDSSRNIYVTGYTLNQHSPGLDLSVPILEKISPEGVLQWTAPGTAPPIPTLTCAFGCNYLNNPPKLHGTAIGFGQGGEVIVGAVGNSFLGGSVDFGSGPFPSYTSEFIYLAAYSPTTGAFTWAKQLPIILRNSLLSMSIDPSGNIVVGGTYSGSMLANNRLLVTSKPEDPTVVSSFLVKFATPSADETAPLISFTKDAAGTSIQIPPPPIVAQATGPSGAKVFFVQPNAIDEGNGGATVLCSPRPNTTFPIGTTTVTCTASDSRGNDSTVSFTVTVVDTLGPVFPPTSDKVVQATSTAGAIVTYPPLAATDQVSGPASVTCMGPTSGSLFPIGRTTISCTATDARGNEGRTEFAVEVQAAGAGPGTACTAAADCGSGFCVDGVCCASACGGGDPNDCQACDINGTCTAFSSLHECRAATGTCDVAEYCDGSSLACPSDAFAASGSICAPASNVCESPGVCSGTNAACSAPAPIPNCGPPTFVGVPGTVAAYATSRSGAKVTYTKPTAVGPGGASVPVSCSPASGAQFPLKTTTVMCTASDGMGNGAMASFTVSVTYQAPTDASFFLTPLTRSTFFRIGRPVPVRFKLTGASANITDLVAKLSVTKISDTVQGTVEGTSDETVEDTDFVFKYRPLLKMYAYRWKSRDQTQGTYRLKADLGDGVLHQIDVSLAAPR